MSERVGATFTEVLSEQDTIGATDVIQLGHSWCNGNATVTACDPAMPMVRSRVMNRSLIVVGSLVVALLVVVYLGVTLSAAIATEEAHLTAKFGGAYPEYREGRLPGVSRRFSGARAMRNREYRAVLGLLAVLALLSWKAL